MDDQDGRRSDVVPVAAARASLTRYLREFRENPDAAPISLGSHRKPEAVLVPYARYRELTARTPPSLGELAVLRDLIERLASASGLQDVRVYGSVSRGEQHEHSDIDLIVSPGPTATLFDIAQFEIDMETLLGVPVSVTSEGALDPVADKRVLDEAVPL